MQPDQRRRDQLKQALTDPWAWSRVVLRRPLRRYQLEPARAIVDSVVHGRGLTFAVMMSRQSGKNETAAHIEAMLLNLYRLRGGGIVKTAPTLVPQLQNSLRRLDQLLDRSPLLTAHHRAGDSIVLGNARFFALSGSESAHVVGATADILLECDEAQDVNETIWQRDFRPMAASTNATTVLWGTAWTSTTLLARTIRDLKRLQQQDGIRRVFEVRWRTVAAEVPPYGRYVAAEIARLGPAHPLIRTQYDLDTIDEEAGMIPAAAQVLMHGTHPRRHAPEPGHVYAMLLDVAGASEDQTAEAILGTTPRRDATALTIVDIVYPPGQIKPSYLIVDRMLWTDVPATSLHAAICELFARWQPVRLVIDSTGIGAGLTSFLIQSLGGSVAEGGRVYPFLFTGKTKSDLGWTLLTLANAGRLQDHANDGSPEQALFWRQVQATELEVLPGPGRLGRWQVRDPELHDDLLISAALVGAIEADPPPLPQDSAIIDAQDPLDTREQLF